MIFTYSSTIHNKVAIYLENLHLNMYEHIVRKKYSSSCIYTNVYYADYKNVILK